MFIFSKNNNKVYIKKKKISSIKKKIILCDLNDIKTILSYWIRQSRPNQEFPNQWCPDLTLITVSYTRPTNGMSRGIFAILEREKKTPPGKIFYCFCEKFLKYVQNGKPKRSYLVSRLFAESIEEIIRAQHSPSGFWNSLFPPPASRSENFKKESLKIITNHFSVLFSCNKYKKKEYFIKIMNESKNQRRNDSLYFSLKKAGFIIYFIQEKWPPQAKQWETPCMEALFLSYEKGKNKHQYSFLFEKIVEDFPKEKTFSLKITSPYLGMRTIMLSEVKYKNATPKEVSRFEMSKNEAINTTLRIMHESVFEGA